MSQLLIAEDDKKIDEAFLKEQAYTLQMGVYSENDTVIAMSRCPSPGIVDSRFYYYMIYRIETGKKYRKIFKVKKIGDDEIWKTELDDSTNLVELTKQHKYKLERLFKQEYDKVKYNGPFSKCEEEDTITLDVLKNIDDFEFEREEDVGKTGMVYQRWDEQTGRVARCLHTITNFIDRKFVQRRNYFTKSVQMEVVEDFFYLPLVPISNERFLSLHGSRAIVSSKNLISDNIVEFVENWQKGKIRKNFQWCIWTLKCSPINEQKIMNLLNGGVNTSEPVVIKQDRKNGKTARIYYNESEIRFFVDDKRKNAGGRNLVKLGVTQLSQKIRKFSKIFLKKSQNLKLVD